MTLPRIATPEFYCKIPSNDIEISFRPFLVKEQKILYFALESNDLDEVNLAIMNILRECIYTKIKFDDLTSFDVEYLFMQLRARSVNEMIDVNLLHSECETYNKISIDIDNVEVQGIVKKKTIQLTDTMGMKLKYPSVGASTANQDLDKFARTFKLILSCVESVWEGDEVYDDFTPEELTDFIERFNDEQFVKLSEFFNTLPKLHYNVEYTCTGCGEKVSAEIEGIKNFFL